ncbi:hypothetical protein JVT61DRAFT_10546 [Boletus reticuloceps]|uniref:Uncharacterized protein n=1 Tax=Boletus reticuloceps TaxID=495285 RepID=A0A8I2YV31_9AGAM|nr:hypothetical protein JVT61DRAFT_10546 [Boletus reticuloceps]
MITIGATRCATRTAVSTHNENATSRLITRSKPPSKGPPRATSQSTAANRTTAPTATSREKANENDVEAATQGKHKHDALAQRTLTSPSNDLPSKFGGVVIKSRALPSTSNHQPLSIVAIRRTSKAAVPQSKVRSLVDIKEDAKPPPVHTDNAMAINAKSTYHPSTVTSSHVIKQEGQLADLSKRTASHLNVKTDTHEEDDNCVLKKQRTSSNVPDEARLFEEQEDHMA